MSGGITGTHPCLPQKDSVNAGARCGTPMPRRGALMAETFTQDDLRMWQRDSADLNEVGLILGVKAGALRELVVQQAKDVMAGYDALRAENVELRETLLLIRAQ